MAEGASLKSTPTWAFALVCSILIVIALLLEHALHLLSLFVKRRKRKTLKLALHQIEGELRNLGFISLLLTIAQQPISRICITRSLGDSFLPCKKRDPPTGVNGVALETCEKQGKLSLISAKGAQQLQMLIFVLAVFHVLSCLLTIALGEAKMRSWETWEEETQSLEHQLSTDPRRFRLPRQTSFGRRHLKVWSNRRLLLWLVCFLRQFTDSVSKADYFALRGGFINAHFAQDLKYDFHKFLRRSLDNDFVMVVKISFPMWIYTILIIFFHAQVFYNHYWLPFIPLVIVLVIGTKLEIIINAMCKRSSQQAVITPGIVPLNLEDSLFWFGKPQLLLQLIHFILIQNSFQLAFFTWTWITFGFRSCYHRQAAEISLSLGIGILVQFLCAYVTLPLHALVAQMGSTMKETIFTKRVLKGLKRWHTNAKRNHLIRASSPTSSPPPMEPLPSRRSEYASPSSSSSHPPPMDFLQSPRSEYPSPSSGNLSVASLFDYPTGRRELIEMQRLAERMMDSHTRNLPHDGEASFRLWQRRGSASEISARTSPFHP